MPAFRSVGAMLRTAREGNEPALSPPRRSSSPDVSPERVGARGSSSKPDAERKPRAATVCASAFEERPEKPADRSVERSANRKKSYYDQTQVWDRTTAAAQERDGWA